VHCNQKRYNKSIGWDEKLPTKVKKRSNILLKGDRILFFPFLKRISTKVRFKIKKPPN
jgi:hypothetical protein